MLKLAQNTFEDLKTIKSPGGKSISWDYFIHLSSLLQQGTSLANKLNSYNEWHEKQNIKVRLTAQTFSGSIAFASSLFSAFIRIFRTWFEGSKI